MKAELRSTASTMARPAEGGWPSPIAAVALIDARGCIVDITVEAAAMLGYEPEDLQGRSLTELAAPGWTTLTEGVLARIRSGMSDDFALMLRGRSGRRTLLEMRARKVDGKGGAPGSHVLVWYQQATRLGGRTCRNDEPLRRLAYGLMTHQEEERSRVAAELHDGVVPLVFMAKLMIEDGLLCLKRGDPGQSAAALVQALERLRDVSGEVRRISMSLHPRMLNDLGLLPTIEWYCRTFTETCSSTRLERHLAADEARISAPLKLEIFRILEEGLNNVARHSAARSVRVELVQQTAVLRLSVKDDGVGFDAEQVVFGNGSGSGGLGLQSIRKRVCATGGQLILESTPGAGTMVGAAWPLTTS